MVQDRAIGLLTVANKKAEIPPSRIGSGVWVNTDFKKKFPPRGSVRLRTQVRGSANARSSDKCQFLMFSRRLPPGYYFQLVMGVS